jgi:glycosyltransferase involved in cell wall biosynthesis
MKVNKPSVCFVALAAWPVLSGDRNIQSVGGAEVQQCFLARNFVKLGFSVTMICMDYGQADDVVIDGVRVLKAHTPAGGFPILRFVHPRFTSVWMAMRRANADIYYQRACGVHTGYAAAFCRLYKRKFVYAAASDADFDPKMPLIHYQRGKVIYAWGIRQAHVVIVQHPNQADHCRELLGKEATLVKSCYTPPSHAKVNSAGYVLWVSTLRKLKRPELFVELARQLPQYQFRIVGGAVKDLDLEAFKLNAASLQNLELIGFVPHAEIEAQFDGARLFVNTSEFEGFPNTFLQSWARGIPTVSYVETGSMLEGKPVVNRVNTLEEMVQVVEYLMSNDIAWKVAGQRSKECFMAEHAIETVTDQYAELFNNLFETKE